MTKIIRTDDGAPLYAVTAKGEVLSMEEYFDSMETAEERVLGTLPKRIVARALDSFESSIFSLIEALQQDEILWDDPVLPDEEIGETDTGEWVDPIRVWPSRSNVDGIRGLDCHPKELRYFRHGAGSLNKIHPSLVPADVTNSLSKEQRIFSADLLKYILLFVKKICAELRVAGKVPALENWIESFFLASSLDNATLMVPSSRLFQKLKELSRKIAEMQSSKKILRDRIYGRRKFKHS